MNKKSLIITFIVAQLVFSQASTAVEVSDLLTQDQRIHNEKMKKLIMQREELEELNKQAKLLKECSDIGVKGCSGNVSAPAGSNRAFLSGAVPFNIQAGEPPESLGKDNSDKPGAKAVRSELPQLLAVQNNSAKLSFNGNVRWAVVGETHYGWKTTYIDASKARIKDTHGTYTLILNW